MPKENNGFNENKSQQGDMVQNEVIKLQYLKNLV